MKVRVFFFFFFSFLFFFPPILEPSFPNPYQRIIYITRGRNDSGLIYERDRWPLVSYLFVYIRGGRLFAEEEERNRRKSFTFQKWIDPRSCNPLNFSPFSKIAFCRKAWTYGKLETFLGWRKPVLIIVAIYRYIYIRRCPNETCEKYRFTFHPCSINYFRDPCNNVAFLSSLGQFLAGNVPRI